MRLERAESFVLSVLLLMATLSVIITQLKHINVIYSEYFFRSAFALTFFGIGQFYRRVRLHPPIATSATAIALFLVAGQTMRLFNYTLLPYQFTSADQFLAALDLKLGFVWSSFAVKISNYPKVTSLLRMVYISSYLQIVTLIFLLGMFAKLSEITRFMMANITAGLITISVWFLFPSSTPVAFQTVSPEIASKLNLVLSTDYGYWLAHAGQQGLKTLSPSALGGIVGFPSFHTVMAILIVWYSKNIPHAIKLFFPVNLLMLPAIVLHGAHNLIDVFGGFLVAAAAIWLSEKNATSIAKLNLKTQTPEQRDPKPLSA
jgi:hypothetical protein